MQTQKLLQHRGVAYLSLVCTFLLFVHWVIPNEKRAVSLSTFDSYFKGYTEIYKMVSIAEINEALAASTDKKIILNIYPVKLSPDIRENDFALRIFFLDGSGTKQLLAKEINSSLFKIQSTYYIDFLKRKNISVSKIPNGYYVEIDEKFIENIDAVSLKVTVEKSQMEYYRLAGNIPSQMDSTKKSTEIIATNNSDSTICKCPPECCHFVIRSSDSTGKCPPECAKLFFSTTVQNVIHRVYKKNLHYVKNKTN